MGLFDGINLDGIRQKAEEGLKAAQDGIEHFDADAAAHAVADAASGAVDNVTNLVKPLMDKQTTEDDDARHECEASDFIELMCCFAAADGQVTQAEMDKLSSIATEMGEGQPGEQIASCSNRIAADCKDFGNLAAAKVNASRVLEKVTLSSQIARLLCWDLLAIGTADGLADDESEFISFVAERVGLDPAVLSELSNYSASIVDITQERESLQQSERSYKQIDPIVTELANRELTILGAAQSLIEDHDFSS